MSATTCAIGARAPLGAARRPARRRPGGAQPRRGGAGAATLVIGGTLAGRRRWSGLVIAQQRPLPGHDPRGDAAARHEDIIRQQAAEKGVPPDLIAAVIFAESHFRDQTSHAGARGLMQITPTTAKLIEKLSGGTTFEPRTLPTPTSTSATAPSTCATCSTSSTERGRGAGGLQRRAETNVAAWGGAASGSRSIEFPETREYVEEVLDKREEYADHYSTSWGSSDSAKLQAMSSRRRAVAGLRASSSRFRSRRRPSPPPPAPPRGPGRTPRSWAAARPIPADWPFVVTLYRKSRLHCGGLLIAPTKVLTRATAWRASTSRPSR